MIKRDLNVLEGDQATICVDCQTVFCLPVVSNTAASFVQMASAHRSDVLSAERPKSAVVSRID
jgi:hypothetical protein